MKCCGNSGRQVNRSTHSRSPACSLLHERTYALAPLCALLALSVTIGCAHGATSTRPMTAHTPSAAVTAKTAPPAHDSFTVHSRTLGEARSVDVYVPIVGRASLTALSVVYIPDGGMEEDLPHVAAAVNSLLALREISR